MTTISTPFPRQFFFKCPKCGEYPVSEETLREFIIPPLQEELDKELKEGASGAKLVFNRCPICEPEGEHEEVRLEVILQRQIK